MVKNADEIILTNSLMVAQTAAKVLGKKDIQIESKTNRWSSVIRDYFLQDTSSVTKNDK